MEYVGSMYKNDREADRSYLRGANMFFTYMFHCLLSMYLHIHILIMIDGEIYCKGCSTIYCKGSKFTVWKKSELMSKTSKKLEGTCEKFWSGLGMLCKNVEMRIESTKIISYQNSVWIGNIF